MSIITFRRRGANATDDFNRADQDLDDANWNRQTFGHLLVSQSRVAGDPATAGGNELVYDYSGRTWTNNQWSRLTLTAFAGSSQMGPAVRVSNIEGTYYGLYASSTKVQLIRSLAGSVTVLVTNNQSSVVGDVLILRVSGSILTGFKNGTAVAGMEAITDTNITTGYAGITGYDIGTTGDNWSGGDIL
jgi:hypothetical protein